MEQIVGILEQVNPVLYKEVVRWLWHTIGQEAPPELDKLPMTKEVPTMLAAELQKEREAIRQKSLLEGLQKGKLEGKLEGILEGKKETARKRAWHCEHRGPSFPYVLRATPQNRFCPAQAPAFSRATL